MGSPLPPRAPCLSRKPESQEGPQSQESAGPLGSGRGRAACPPARLLRLRQPSFGVPASQGVGTAPAAPRRGGGVGGTGEQVKAPLQKGELRRRGGPGPRRKLGPQLFLISAATAHRAPRTETPPLGPGAGALLRVPPLWGHSPGKVDPSGAAPSHHPVLEHSAAPATKPPSIRGLEWNHSILQSGGSDLPQPTSNSAPRGTQNPPGDLCAPQRASGGAAQWAALGRIRPLACWCRTETHPQASQPESRTQNPPSRAAPHFSGRRQLLRTGHEGAPRWPQPCRPFPLGPWTFQGPVSPARPLPDSARLSLDPS